MLSSMNVVLSSWAVYALAGLCSAHPNEPRSAEAVPLHNTTNAVHSIDCNGRAYAYHELAGYGFVPSDARDKFGDTIGGVGSSISIDKKSWTRKGDRYTGVLWALPDRGWNIQGTLNYQNRVHKFSIELLLRGIATVDDPSPPNLSFQYTDIILFTGPNGSAVSGLDADADGPYLSFDGTDLPPTTYVGDGFGGNGTGGHRVSIDSEGLVPNADGSFWVSDEYGPYIYKFSRTGSMLETFPYYDPTIEVFPANNPSGRSNNQGFEGLTASADGKKLYVLLQSALNQEGGLKKNRRYTRFLKYDISGAKPEYEAEYIVPLPLYGSGSVAAQSEILLARDSNAGRGQSETQSSYRHIDVIDISNATNVTSAVNDAFNGSIASTTGTLRTGIQPAAYCSFLDINSNSQLNRFGVHNGGDSDAGLLNETWESLAIVPVNNYDPDSDEYFVFAFSDNDFITHNGYLNSGRYQYANASGYNLDNQALVFKVSLPRGARPS